MGKSNVIEAALSILQARRMIMTLARRAGIHEENTEVVSKGKHS
jgi:hypothetical protein